MFPLRFSFILRVGCVQFIPTFYNSFAVKKTTLFLLLLIITAITLLTGCGDKSKRLSLSGSSTVAPLAAEIARLYEKQQPDLRVDVQTGGSSRGVTDAIEGRVDIGMASRALKAEEIEKLEAVTIANDGIACIVHADNPLRDLSEKQIRAIFTGQYKNWAELDAGKEKIVVVTKAEGRSTLELFCHHFKLKPADIKAEIVIGDNAQGIKSVAASPLAIGYVSIGAAETAIREGTPIRLLKLEGQEPSVENLRLGVWPIARPLNLLIPKSHPASKVIQGFLDFATSSEVNAIIEDLAFVAPKKTH